MSDIVICDLCHAQSIHTWRKAFKVLDPTQDLKLPIDICWLCLRKAKLLENDQP